MVFCGAFSKGCERCRRRKVKVWFTCRSLHKTYQQLTDMRCQCDQRQPACFKCEKLGKHCPGYRNLDDVLFRDESERVTRKLRQMESLPSALVREVLVIPHSIPFQNRVGVPHQLPQPLTALGANFFFTKYTFSQPPFSAYHDWLAQSYSEHNNTKAFVVV